MSVFLVPLQRSSRPHKPKKLPPWKNGNVRTSSRAVAAPHDDEAFGTNQGCYHTPSRKTSDER